MLKQLFISIFFVSIYFSELSACKIWAIISKQDRSLNIQSQDELFLVNEQLGVYYNQSQYNANGWSVLQYPLSQTADGINVYRSASPANYDSLNYWNEMLSLFNDFGVDQDIGSSSIKKPLYLEDYARYLEQRFDSIQSNS
mgnify:CR=1 FL=1